MSLRTTNGNSIPIQLSTHKPHWRRRRHRQLRFSIETSLNGCVLTSFCSPLLCKQFCSSCCSDPLIATSFGTPSTPHWANWLILLWMTWDKNGTPNNWLTLFLDTQATCSAVLSDCPRGQRQTQTTTTSEDDVPGSSSSTSVLWLQNDIQADVWRLNSQQSPCSISSTTSLLFLNRTRTSPFMTPFI